MKILDPSLKVKAGMPVSLAPINSMKMNLLLGVRSINKDYGAER